MGGVAEGTGEELTRNLEELLVWRLDKKRLSS
jgi:hypothetical protein